MTTRVDHAMLGAGNDLMPKSGGTFTGPVTLNGDASSALHPVPKQQLDATLQSYEKIQLFAVKNINSGTTVTFSPADGTGIPSWAKRITVCIHNLSTSTTAFPLLRIGTSAGLVTSGYNSAGALNATSTSAAVLATNGFNLGSGTGNWSAAVALSGSWILTLMDSTTNTWTLSGSGSRADTNGLYSCGGAVSIAGTLDRLSVMTSDLVGVFDGSGVISILVEG